MGGPRRPSGAGLRKKGTYPAPNGHRFALYFIPPGLAQIDYDHLLWACDLNFVRGEDSFVRALWAGLPFIWHIYPQDDGAHAAKLKPSSTGWSAPVSLRPFHRVWNGTEPSAGRRRCPRPIAPAWSVCAQSARGRLLARTTW